MKRHSFASIMFFCSIFLLAVLIMGGTFYMYAKNRTVYNDSPISGNTAGNLYNGGLYCEFEGKVYFSNAYDEGDLYSMNPDETNIKKLNTDTVQYINVAGKHIYYAKNNLNEKTSTALFRGNLFGVYRMNLDGSNIVSLSNEPSGVVSLATNTVLYQNYSADTGLTLCEIGIDAENSSPIEDTAINPSCIVDNIMYYIDTASLNIYQMDTVTYKKTKLYDQKAWMITYDNGYLYFMDADHDYHLVRMNLNRHEIETIINARIDTYNLYEEMIYYQESGDSPQFCRIKKDGSDWEKILDGTFANINITSEYVYFTQYGMDAPVYQTPTSAPIYITKFQAAAKNQKE